MSYEGIVKELRETDNRFGSLSLNNGTWRVYDYSPGSSGTVTVGGGTVNVTGTLTGANPTDGTLTQLGTLYYVDTVKQIGTLPNLIIDSGTVAANPTMGTLNTVTQVGTLPNIIIGSGTAQQVTYIPNVGTLFYAETLKEVGTLPNIIVGSGTIQTINNGTISTIGTLPNKHIVTGKQIGRAHV